MNGAVRGGSGRLRHKEAWSGWRVRRRSASLYAWLYSAARFGGRAGAASNGGTTMRVRRWAVMTVAGAALAASLGACQGGRYGQKETIGTLGGAALGGFVGSQIGS